MDKSFFINNRTEFFKSLDRNSVAVLFSGRSPHKSADEYYPFSVNRNFYYLTGISSPEIFFTVSGRDMGETLFCERGDGLSAKWTGAKLTGDEAKALSGIECVKYIDEFDNFFWRLIEKNNADTLYLDLENRDGFGFGPEFAERALRRKPDLKIKDAYKIITKMRSVKHTEELELIKKAVDITAEGFKNVMKNVRPGMYEYEAEAYFDFSIFRGGAFDNAFKTIAASGKNACVLHYPDNNSIIKDGDLLLVDAGAQVSWYNGDLTRTFPVNGKFSKRQKLFYNIVLEGQERALSSIRPGITLNGLDELLKDYYYEELHKLGLAETKDEVSKYYFHRVSHHLGADTHDVGAGGDEPLESGMVITVEPGLYLEEYGIGIRIEDDVLVTETGCENLSHGLPKTTEEIEAFMCGGK